MNVETPGFFFRLVYLLTLFLPPQVEIKLPFHPRVRLCWQSVLRCSVVPLHVRPILCAFFSCNTSLWGTLHRRETLEFSALSCSLSLHTLSPCFRSRSPMPLHLCNTFLARPMNTNTCTHSLTDSSMEARTDAHSTKQTNKHTDICDYNDYQWVK